MSEKLHAPAALPRESTKVNTEQEVGEPHSRSERFQEEKNLLPLPGFKPQTVHPLA